MFGLLKMLVINKKRSAVEAAAKKTPIRSTSSTPAMNKELIRLALKDTIKAFGVPLEWIQCDVVDSVAGSARARINIVLEMQCWDEDLLRYSQLISKYFLKKIGLYLPGIDLSTFQISWSFGMECHSPYSVMPPVELWTPISKAPRHASASEYFDRRKKMRDGTASVHIHDDGLPNTDNEHYAPTAHSPLA